MFVERDQLVLDKPDETFSNSWYCSFEVNFHLVIEVIFKKFKVDVLILRK